MSRLIDADKLIKKFKDAQKRAIEVWGKEEIGMIPLDDLIDIINHAPTAIEIVRCKDCIYHKDEEPGMVFCPNFTGSWVCNDFFCADGERKDYE